MVNYSPSNAGGAGSIPGGGGKIPHASPAKSQNIKQKQYCNKFNKDLGKWSWARALGIQTQTGTSRSQTFPCSQHGLHAYIPHQNKHTKTSIHLRIVTSCTCTHIDVNTQSTCWTQRHTCKYPPTDIYPKACTHVTHRQMQRLACIQAHWQRTHSHPVRHSHRCAHIAIKRYRYSLMHKHTLHKDA